MAIATQLFELDQIDAELDHHRAALAEVWRIVEGDPKVEAIEKRLAEARSSESSAAREQRRLEGDLDDLETRIKRDHGRIYGGQIVDPRELASLEKELQHFRTQRGELEERLLGMMEQVEALQGEIVALDRQTNELREQRQTDRPALERRAEELIEETANLQAERESRAAALDPRALNAYVRLRKASTHAVSHVSDGVCQWCRVSIPPKDVQHARAGALVTCSNCARILYVG